MKSCLVTVRKDRFEISTRAGWDTNDVNLAYLLGATEHYWGGDMDLEKFRDYDLIIFTMTKIKESYENKWLQLISLLRDKYGTSKKIILYQEAEVDWCIQRNDQFDEQLDLFHAIALCDVFLCHNKADEGFFQYLFPVVKVINVPTPMPIEKISQNCAHPDEKRKKVLEIVFGSSFDNRAMGMFGYAVGMELKRKFKDRIKLVQYHRSEWPGRNDKVRNYFGYEFESLPHLSWMDFVKRLSSCYLSMNLMNAAAAGRDAIVFGALGIPHVGNSRLNVLDEIVLGTNIYDLKSVYSFCEMVLENNSFYDLCRDEITKRVQKFSFVSVKAYLVEKLNAIGWSVS